MARSMPSLNSGMSSASTFAWFCQPSGIATCTHPGEIGCDPDITEAEHAFPDALAASTSLGHGDLAEMPPQFAVLESASASASPTHHADTAEKGILVIKRDERPQAVLREGIRGDVFGRSTGGRPTSALGEEAVMVCTGDVIFVVVIHQAVQGVVVSSLIETSVLLDNTNGALSVSTVETTNIQCDRSH